MTADQPSTAITLRALEGAPLDDDGLRNMVIATAHAIAERQGVVVNALATTPDSITATLACSRIEAIGFAAELRRLTTQWYTQKYGEETLWGEPHARDRRPGEIDDADWWKQA